MYYAIKFKDDKALSDFRIYCDYVSWYLYDLRGAGGCYCLELPSGDDDIYAMEYLHKLGAFQFCEENAGAAP